MKKTTFLLLVAQLIPFSAYSSFNELEEPARSPQLQEYSPGFFGEEKNSVEIQDQETQGTLPNPEELETSLKTLGDINIFLKFAQTRWNECTENPSGNYLTYNCTQRTVSEMLNTYLDKFLLMCTDEALEAQGGGRAQAVHLVHAGVTADPRHSPRSLHAENRAIDIKVMKVRLSNGQNKQFTYSLAGNRPFYTALRKCWGDKVNRYNGCPLAEGTTLKTGSIGWENRDHGHHMHLSVPYCVNGRYGSGFYQR